MSMLHALMAGMATMASRVIFGPPGAKTFNARPRLELEETPESLARRLSKAHSAVAREERRDTERDERVAQAKAKRSRRASRNLKTTNHKDHT
jgi:hypothetical protein